MFAEDEEDSDEDSVDDDDWDDDSDSSTEDGGDGLDDSVCLPGQRYGGRYIQSLHSKV